jgi:hypothetical protein
MASAATPSGAQRDVVTLHSSWTGIVAAFTGAAIIAAFAAALIARNGVTVVNGVFALVVLALLAVVALDLPIASEFRPDGVLRRALLRHQWIEWDDVTRLGRLRVGVLRTVMSRRGGGLVADINGRNYVLVDRMESAMEFDRLRQVLGERAASLVTTADMRPPEGRSPTWLYRRQEWRPESARRR